MKEHYPAVFALLGVEEMQMSEGGAFMNEGLLQTLNEKIEALQKEKADALALVESLTAEKSELTAKVEEMTTQMETLNTEHAQAIEEKDNAISALEQEKADLQGELNAKAESMETMQGELNTAKENLTNAQNTIVERDQQISDLNDTIEELKTDAGEGAPAISPENNGAGADNLHQASGAPQWDPSKSASENKAAMDAYEQSLRKQVK